MCFLTWGAVQDFLDIRRRIRVFSVDPLHVKPQNIVHSFWILYYQSAPFPYVCRHVVKLYTTKQNNDVHYFFCRDINQKSSVFMYNQHICKNSILLVPVVYTWGACSDNRMVVVTIYLSSPGKVILSQE